MGRGRRSSCLLASGPADRTAAGRPVALLIFPAVRIINTVVRADPGPVADIQLLRVFDNRGGDD